MPPLREIVFAAGTAKSAAKNVPAITPMRRPENEKG